MSNSQLSVMSLTLHTVLQASFHSTQSLRDDGCALGETVLLCAVKALCLTCFFSSKTQSDALAAIKDTGPEAGTVGH